MIDLYTKTVLTVIAGALLSLVVQNFSGQAVAQGGGCGATARTPCWV